MAQTVSPSGSAGPFAVVKIFSEQTEFPELIGNVFANVGDGAVGADDDFVLDVFFVVRRGVCPLRLSQAPALAASSFHGNDPAASHFSGGSQLNDAGGFQFLESGIPEFEVKDFAFASEQVVGNSETSHGFQVQADDGVGDDVRDFGFFAAIFFDGFQRSAAQFRGAGFVFFKKVRSFGVEIPAVVIEARLHGRHFDADGTADVPCRGSR